MFALSLFLFLLKAVSINSSSCQNQNLILNRTEYDALYDFYNTTSGPNWKWTNSTTSIKWNFTSCQDPCVSKWEVLLISLFLNNLS